MFKKIYTLAGEYKNDFTKGAILTVIEAMFIGSPLLFLYLTLRELFHTETMDPSRIVWWCVGLVVVVILRGLFHHWASLTNSHMTYFRCNDLRIRLGEHIRKLSMGFFTTRQAGDLQTVISQDIKITEPVSNWILPDIVAMATIMPLTAIFLLFIDWRMALATLMVVPIALAEQFWMQNRFKAHARRRQKAIVDANARMVEYVQGIQVIKAFNQTGDRFDKFEKALRAFRDTEIDVTLKMAWPMAAPVAILELGLSLIMLLGAYLLFGGTLAVDVFLMFLVISVQFYEPLKRLALYLSILRVAEAALDHIEGTLAIQPLPEPADDPELTHFDIEFDHVRFRYEDSDVLRDVSFRLPEHTLTALVGPSGAGKTTIANLVARFWDVDAGAVRAGGRDVKDIKTDRLLSYMAMVFQDVYLFNDTLGNNIRFGKKDVTMDEVIAAARAARCHDFISALPDGYDTIVGEGGATLSGGEKQRVSIARAILKDAPIVILDEATVYVDPENEALIQQAITALAKGRTLIIIAHRLPTITGADQILVIDHGLVVERGRHTELLAQGGAYSRMWAAQERARGWTLACKRRFQNERQNK